MRWFEAPARTAAPKGHHLHLLRSTAFNPRITYTRIRPPALVAHLFSRTRSPPAAPCSPPAAWRSRPIRRRLRGPGPRRPSSCAWSTPDPHGLRNQVVGGGHGRDRALLLQDLANDLLLELIGVFGSGHELTPHLSREETLPKSRGPRSLHFAAAGGSGRTPVRSGRRARRSPRRPHRPRESAARPAQAPAPRDRHLTRENVC